MGKFIKIGSSIINKNKIKYLHYDKNDSKQYPCVIKVHFDDDSNYLCHFCASEKEAVKKFNLYCKLLGIYDNQKNEKE